MSLDPAPAAILIRVRPDVSDSTAVLDRVREWTRRPGPSGGTLVFFHGAGVDHALSGQARAWRRLSEERRLELVVCETAWRRRHRNPPPDGWRTGSLAQFWSMAEADRIECLGLNA